MDLFKLFGTVAINSAEAKQQLSDISGKAEDTGSKMSGTFAKIGGAAVKMGVAAVGAMAAAAGALLKSSIESYAEYEQLVGGVETLFKESADSVMSYAANAYKTAGLSANEYMATVTSFSASLLQSLGGDTAKATEYADKAITDMSDNANKMGTDMSMIQNAYQGFAKQNYMMLDNLKLGYGGTKTEMERLIEDANKLREEQGLNADLTIESYADIVEAIHTVQTEIGITGTTQLEASTTIQGSINSLKSAWKNTLTGMADDSQDFGQIVSNLVESAKTAAGNLLPRIKTTLLGIGKLIEELAPVISEALPVLVTEVIPELLRSGAHMLESLLKGILDNIDAIGESAVDIVTLLITTMISMTPTLFEIGFKLLMSVMDGLINNLDAIIDAAVQTIVTLAKMLTDPDNIKKLLEAALTLVKELAFGLMEALPELVDAAIQIIFGLVEFLLDPENILMLVEAAIEIVIAIGVGLIKAIPQLLMSVAELVGKLIEGIFSTDWGQVGKDIISKLWEGLKELWGSLVSWFSDAWDGIKNWFGDIFGGKKKVEVAVENGELTGSGGRIDGSFASGLDYVPRDGFTAELHKGEMVVPADESEQIRSGRTEQNDDVVNLLGQILEAVHEGQTIDINKREFGRLVRGVV